MSGLIQNMLTTHGHSITKNKSEEKEEFETRVPQPPHFSSMTTRRRRPAVTSALPSLEVGPPVGIAFYIHIDTHSSRFGTIHVHDEVLDDFDALVAGNC